MVAYTVEPLLEVLENHVHERKLNLLRPAKNLSTSFTYPACVSEGVKRHVGTSNIVYYSEVHVSFTQGG